MLGTQSLTFSRSTVGRDQFAIELIVDRGLVLLMHYFVVSSMKKPRLSFAAQYNS